jgi:hypothetical protein
VPPTNTATRPLWYALSFVFDRRVSVRLTMMRIRGGVESLGVIYYML